MKTIFGSSLFLEIQGINVFFLFGMKCFAFLLSLFVVLFFATSQLNAQILFHADFEDTSGVNNPAAWNANNVTAGKNVFTVKGGVLKQTSNECNKSTKTPFPVDGSGWTDYTVAIDVWDRDNDCFAILFRYTDSGNYYNFAIGASDFGNTWYLGDSIAREIVCDWPPWDPGTPTITTGHIRAITRGMVYTAAVKVTGNKIELFFGVRVDTLAGKLPAKIGEATDSTHTKGTAGLYMASNPADFDNIIVYGPKPPFAVEPRGKLATTWVQIKSAAY